MKNLHSDIYHATQTRLTPVLTMVRDNVKFYIIMKHLVKRKTSCIDESKIYLKRFKMEKTYYKIVQLTGDKYKTLFHGINGSKVLNTNEWIDAVIKDNVSDGKGATYTSGIYIIDGYGNALNYMNRFKREDIVVVKCLAKGVKHKAKNKPYVYLADSICIIEK